jgi:hypothetical protein
MIRGSEITLDTFGLEPATVLESVVRVIARRWPSCVLVDAEICQRLDSFEAGAFGGLRELLVFRDEPSREIWERLGADPDNAHTLIYAIAGARSVTLVVEDPRTALARAVIDELTALFTNGTPWQSWRAA